MTRSVGNNHVAISEEDKHPLLIKETYSGEAVHEYVFQGKKTRPRKRPLRQRIHDARALFAEVFLPQGYPATVSPDYLDYQFWDTVQAFASSQNGALATLAVLRGVGVGNEQATVLAAALTWLLKDGVGMIARIVFAWARGSRLDSDNKRWRLVADLLNDVSFMLELLAANLSQLFFTPFACVVALLRAVVDVSGRTTRMAVIRHQARRDNLADVAAKDGSQEMLVNFFSLLCSLALLPNVEGHHTLIWALFMLFTYVHLFANYKAAKACQFETLNQARFHIAVRHFLHNGTAPSIRECNLAEPILSRLCTRLRHLHLGCPLGALPTDTEVEWSTLLTSGRDGMAAAESRNGHISWKWTGQRKAICMVDREKATAWMLLAEGATNEDMSDGLFAIEHFGEGKGWPSDPVIANFRQQMTAQGWSLHHNQLNIDEWRFSKSENGFGGEKKKM